MIILAIETTGASASVALIDKGGNVHQETSIEKLSHLQNLIPMVDRLLDSCKLTIKDITHIAVSKGPGSFTGIRIGMATGKALAQALNLPVVGVPTLRSFRWNIPDFHGLICPVLDARRGQVYGGVYLNDGDLCAELIKEDAWYMLDYLHEIDKLVMHHHKDVMFFGDGVKVYEDMIKRWAISTKRLSPNDDMSRIIANLEKRFQMATSVTMEAIQMIKAEDIEGFDSLTPVYLRKAEAERKLEQKRKSERVSK